MRKTLAVVILSFGLAGCTGEAEASSNGDSAPVKAEGGCCGGCAHEGGAAVAGDADCCAGEESCGEACAAPPAAKKPAEGQ